MPEISSYPPNTFCWPELATSDPDGAKQFYGNLMGWAFHDDAVGPDAVYTLALKAGKNVGGLFLINEEMKAEGVPPNWLSYVSVADADTTAAKVKALGGKMVRDPQDAGEGGRMAVIEDPTGGVFAIWQPKEHIGAQLVNEHGTLTWNELMTTDVDKAGKFYTHLFDWGSQTADMGGFQYTSFMNGDRPAGGMMQIDPKTMGDIPPNWMVYFAVDDCDGAAAAVKRLGGTVVEPPRDIPEVGRMAVVMDPQCAGFAVIKLKNPPA
jgi:predicted enzyme related to lactoylglutathione lyase